MGNKNSVGSVVPTDASLPALENTIDEEQREVGLCDVRLSKLIGDAFTEKVNDSGIYETQILQEMWFVTKNNLRELIETLDLQAVVSPPEIEDFLKK